VQDKEQPNNNQDLKETKKINFIN